MKIKMCGAARFLNKQIIFVKVSLTEEERKFQEKKVKKKKINKNDCMSLHCTGQKSDKKKRHFTFATTFHTRHSFTYQLSVVNVYVNIDIRT